MPAIGAQASASVRSDHPTPAVTPAGRLARFGPFVVIDPSRAVLEGVTDRRSPAAFLDMLRHYPLLRELEMRDCPGTVDDAANLRLGRMIRQYRIATRVPEKGSVRSGAIELFLAGAERHAAGTARFVIHAWSAQGEVAGAGSSLSATMRETYTNYYRAMGMAAGGADEFYRRTMAVPARSGLSLTPDELARYVTIRPDLQANAAPRRVQRPG